MDFTVDQKRAYTRATSLCARTETCAADLRQKMKSWKVPPEEIPGVIERLRQEGFIDDERYARAFVRDKFRFNGWGKKKIVYMLRSKAIAPEVIEAVFAEFGEEDFREKLRQSIMDKARHIRDDDPYKKRLKLIRFALSRGFDLDEANAILDEMESSE